MREQSPLKERLIAVALKAFSEGGIEHFKARDTPIAPVGYNEAYMKYLSAKEKDKQDLWGEIKQAYAGYFKKLNEVKSENYSNKKYLQEVRELFREKEMEVHVKRLDEIIRGFDYVAS